MPHRLPELREAVAVVAAQARRARSGSGRLVLLRGATGTGRTTVLEAAAEEAAEAGMVVLRARCSPADATIPFSTVLQLLGPVPDFEELAADGDERTTAAGLWRVLRSYAERAPLLVAVDDVHLADAASHRWLVEAARYADRLPLVLAVTERSQYDVDPPVPGIAHTLAPALVRTHILTPLTESQAVERVRAAFPDASVRWTEDCVRAGACSPLLLRALLTDLGAGRHTAVPVSCAALYPGAYREAVAWSLDSAGPGTTEVARALAVLDEGWDRTAAAPARGPAGLPVTLVPGCPGGPCCPAEDQAGLLAELSGTDPVRVAGWLTAMSGLGLLRPGPGGHLTYAHPLLRDAVLTDVPAVRRHAAHRAAAETLLRHGAPADAVARRLLLADPVDAPWALAVLQEAAALALREDRPDDAVAFLRRALDEPLPDDRRQPLLTELGSLEYAARHASAGIPRLAEALRLPGTPQDRVRAAVALGTALTGRGRTRAAVEVLRSVDGQLAGRPDLARILQTASALLADRDGEVRQEVYGWLTRTAEHTPVLVGPAGRALLVRHAATAGLLSAQDAMARLRVLLTEPTDPLSELFLVGTAAAVSQWADELDEAQRLVERGLAVRPDVLHPMHEALLNVRTDTAAARGDWPVLLAGALPPSAACPHPTNGQAQALIALVETDRLAEAERFAAAFDLREAPDSWEVNRFLYARGLLRAAAGDPAAAVHDFLECGRRQSAREVASPVVTPWRTATAECRLALGQSKEALALAEEELRLARLWNTPRTQGRALRVLGTATGGRRGLELTAEAVALLRDSPASSELVSALLALGRQLASAGETSRAREVLREAADRAEAVGALRLRGLAEQALRDGGARRASARTGAGSLTGSERRIAELAATGRTNAEISDLLHLARRTVETHLTNSYRKLGIRRRNELRTALGGGEG
ncbi:AAA family ATPase [Streptomyces sp. NPDC047000]|uniref:helix-turn-helix transcriptional regulator n=1 Tax=Streptomyces sp. NPDC047000 TaxID=3155474 RepID=UPI0033D7505A